MRWSEERSPHLEDLEDDVELMCGYAFQRVAVGIGLHAGLRDLHHHIPVAPMSTLSTGTTGTGTSTGGSAFISSSWGVERWGGPACSRRATSIGRRAEGGHERWRRAG